MRFMFLSLAVLLLSACTTAPALIPPPATPLLEPVAEPKKPSFEQEGQASWYGNKHHGRKTANGERFNQHALTAAHRTLPFNSRIVVTNIANGKTVTVRINDRGPYSKNRVLDVSRKAAEALGMIQSGTAQVRLYTLDE